MIKSRGEKIFILFLFFIVIEIFLAKCYLAKTFFSTNTRKDSLISSWLARISSLEMFVQIFIHAFFICLAYPTPLNRWNIKYLLEDAKKKKRSSGKIKRVYRV